MAAILQIKTDIENTDSVYCLCAFIEKIEQVKHIHCISTENIKPISEHETAENIIFLVLVLVLVHFLSFLPSL